MLHAILSQAVSVCCMQFCNLQFACCQILQYVLLFNLAPKSIRNVYVIALLLGHQMVVLGQSIHITQLFHQRAKLLFPMVLTTKLCYAGKSSFAIAFTLIDEQTGDVVLTAQRLLTVMDANAGKSVVIPETIR